MKKKICKICGSENCIPNRRLCADCYTLWNRQKTQRYYREKGRNQRVLYEKSLDENSVNCWDNLRVSQTTAWLETTSANVIKLWELVNQQPSLFNNEEGSETKHGAPKSK